MSDSAFLATLGFALILMGFIVVFVAIILLLFSSANDEKRVKGGSAIIIGPFPIVFGTDRKSVKILLILSIILMVFVLLANIAFNYL
ncbi:MAG: DUF131 domain-containing protein [Candidatus Bathyarchaeota archaeon]|nr:DUF131 domain-containing protein [Candidatus Bathyarchaeota archaeon]MDH5494534.1 DUF131 domain-containing protein [Candidatus Bathyarchaeota archaeon]